MNGQVPPIKFRTEFLSYRGTDSNNINFIDSAYLLFLFSVLPRFLFLFFKSLPVFPSNILFLSRSSLLTNWSSQRNYLTRKYHLKKNYTSQLLFHFIKVSYTRVRQTEKCDLTAITNLIPTSTN